MFKLLCKDDGDATIAYAGNPVDIITNFAVVSYKFLASIARGSGRETSDVVEIYKEAFNAVPEALSEAESNAAD